MEDSDVFQKEGKAMAKGGGGERRPPSRLQKQAPKAALQLDNDMYNAANPLALSSGDVASRCPIPLLSPLVVAPPPLPEYEDKGMKGTSRSDHGGSGKGNGSDGGDDDKKKGGSASTPPPGGWRHPATSAPFSEPSSLFSFFHSQCYIVPHHTQ